MKKFITILLCLTLSAVVMSGCAKNAETFDSGKLNIVTTIFPEYDWVKEIVGSNTDHTELYMLLDNGVDLHSYQPTANDLIRISNCDLFIYVGGESDAWVSDALKGAKNPNRIVINLLEELGDNVKTEELVEGMEAEHDSEEEKHDDITENGYEGEEPEEEEDEHVWLSLKNAETLCKAIADKLSYLDPEHKDDYIANMNTYINKLETLDIKYKEMTDHSAKDTILFGDRFPFRYLADDYNLSYYAAFAGCSAETEASFGTITFLAGKVDELDLSCVLTIEGTKHQIAETIIASTQNKNQRLLTMDSMQSVTLADVKNGTTYLAIMEKNLEVLQDALN